jgi:alginate O-acetyltransferase complex protein AlgI
LLGLAFFILINIIYIARLFYWIKNGVYTVLHLRKFWFWLSIIINLGFLGVFKYYNFFAESFAQAFSQIGLYFNLCILKVILPVGISFYTFHGLSYVIDIYKNRIKPEKDFIELLICKFFSFIGCWAYRKSYSFITTNKS